ncbi:MAG: preprotein translocase subunit SecY [Candidatus Aenigmatarchaeota archaeon]
MSFYINLLQRLPSIQKPLQVQNFKSKLKWTGAILILYFLMGQISVWGIVKTSFERFRIFEILLGSSFGSLMTLGIGPIVTASIILQLLVGSKVIPWDLRTEEGRILFNGTQKLLAFLFCFVEASAFVIMGAIPAEMGLEWAVILQLAMGGILVVFMDELISKWGFGSGVSLFIVAGVSKSIIVRALNPLTTSGMLPGAEPPAGLLPFAITALAAGEPMQAGLALMPIIATIIVFLIVVYANAIKVEIPIAFSSISGFGRRWPLKFFYTSNLPVILVAALLANIHFMARVLADRGIGILGGFDAEGNAVSGIIYYLSVPHSQALSGFMIFISMFALMGAVINYKMKRSSIWLVLGLGAMGGFVWWAITSMAGLTSLAFIPLADIARLLTYMLFMMIGCIIFSVFWVATSGMDPASVARQIESIGMQIPGYRRDARIIESVLKRYIPTLTIVGGAAVGFLAAFADMTGALGTGTGILLSSMIIYNLYEELAAKHLEDMHPALRKFME